MNIKFHGCRCLAILLVLSCLIFTVPGCKSGSGRTVQGKVSIGGVPLETGNIAFMPLEAGKGTAVGGPITKGAYVVQNLFLGKYRVTFSATKATGKMNTEYSTPYPEVVSMIPEKYNSGLEIEVTADKKDYDFDLTN